MEKNRRCPQESQSTNNNSMFNQQCSLQTRAFLLHQVFVGKQLPDKEVEQSTLIIIPKVQSSQTHCQAPFVGVYNSITLLRKLTTRTMGCREKTELLETTIPTFFSTRMWTLIQSALMTHPWTCMPIVLHMTHVTNLEDCQTGAMLCEAGENMHDFLALPMAFTFFVGNSLGLLSVKGFFI